MKTKYFYFGVLLLIGLLLLTTKVIVAQQKQTQDNNKKANDRFMAKGKEKYVFDKWKRGGSVILYSEINLDELEIPEDTTDINCFKESFNLEFMGEDGEYIRLGLALLSTEDEAYTRVLEGLSWRQSPVLAKKMSITDTIGTVSFIDESAEESRISALQGNCSLYITGYPKNKLIDLGRKIFKLIEKGRIKDKEDINKPSITISDKYKKYEFPHHKPSKSITSPGITIIPPKTVVTINEEILLSTVITNPLGGKTRIKIFNNGQGQIYRRKGIWYFSGLTEGQAKISALVCNEKGEIAESEKVTIKIEKPVEETPKK